ncbi:MAG: hypothetical protein ACYTFY_04360 [Planctomycetota bacterium]|jgi:tetratricopeptide (TPR) repeat protein
MAADTENSDNAKVEAESLAEEKSSLIEDYLRLRTDSESDRKAKRALKKATGKLDTFYWKWVDLMVKEAVQAGRDTLSFSDEDKIFIDMGLVDLALVEGADEALPEQLMEERNTGGLVNHYYFTEWLEDRFKRFMLTEQMEKETSTSEEGKNSELVKLKDARSKITGKLKPFFKGLPGVTEQISNHFINGQLDDQINLLSVALLDVDERQVFMKRHSLRNLRLQIISKLRGRLNSETDFKLVDMLDVIYGKIWKESYSQYEGGESSASDASGISAGPGRRDLDKLSSYIEGEIKFAKSLLPLGALAGGITRCCSVLLENCPRINKEITRVELDRCREADRGFSVSPAVLIAPFQGRGFFEWDRDSLFVPLVPVDSSRSSISNASANYRMLIDSFQQDGALKSSYEELFSGANFQEAFQKDYRTWMSTVGSGEIDGMEDQNREFFMNNVGPDYSGVIAPANLKNLGEEARKSLRVRLEKQIKAMSGEDANLYYRLGVLYWQDSLHEKAIAKIAQSLSLDGKNGIALFSLALLLGQSGNEAKSKQAFQVCIKRVPESIWASYSRLFLEGKLK